MAGDASGLRMPLGWAVAVIVAFLAIVNVIDIRVTCASLRGPRGHGGVDVGFPVTRERLVLADGGALAGQPED
jgi:hypothetical protein